MLLLCCLSTIQIFSYPLGERSFHLFVDLKQAIVFISGKISPQVLRYLHKPTKIISFLCWFFNNSVLLHSFHCILSFLPEALWYWSLRPIFLFCQDRVLFVLIHLTRVLCSHSSSFILSSFASLFNLRAVWNPSYPLCHSFNSSGRSVLLISSSIIPSSQVHVQFLPFTVGVLSKLYHSYSLLSHFNQSAAHILPLSSYFNRSGFEFYLVH